MPISETYTPEPAFAALGDAFSDAVEPADFPQAIPRFWNGEAAESVGLAGLSPEERAAHFARFEPLPGQPGPRAMRYHGHQFRTYNPELGDGRGFLAAQLRADDGRLLDLGTKGSGVTPWSRSGDGRLTLKGGVREVLATALLQRQGVPTSRSFALFETGEALVRGDEPSPTRSAVLTRLSWSHVRFGTFQRLAYFGHADEMRALIDHVCTLYYPDLLELDGAAARASALLEAVGGRMATMAAGWMAAGFVHGVLNTDNMNINGESFDYGPWRWLPYSDPEFTAAYFDHSGLYSYGRQPHAVFWNLQQLAAALTLLEVDKDALLAALNAFGTQYRRAVAYAMLRRLAVAPLDDAAGEALAESVFAALAEGAPALRWEPFFHDWRGGVAAEERAMSGPRATLYSGAAASAFRGLLRAHAPLAEPARGEPEEMLIEEVEAIWSAIAERDDWGPFEAKLARLAAPL